MRLERLPEWEPRVAGQEQRVAWSERHAELTHQEVSGPPDWRREYLEWRLELAHPVEELVLQRSR